MFTKKIFSALTIIGMLVVLATVTGAQSDESEAGVASRLKAQDKKAKQLSGTWAVIVTITSPRLGQPSPAFNTYTVDGDVLVDFVPRPGTIAYTGHGEWIRTGDRQFALTFVSLEFDEKGIFTGTFKARETLTLNEALNESTGQVKWEVATPTGQVVASGDATTRGKRISVEPVE